MWSMRNKSSLHLKGYLKIQRIKIAMMQRCQRFYVLPVHGNCCRLASFLFSSAMKKQPATLPTKVQAA